MSTPTTTSSSTEKFDLLRTHNELQQLLFNPIVPISTFALAPINVVMVTQQIGNAQAGKDFMSTYQLLMKAEGYQAFAKGFFSQYLAFAVEEKIRRYISTRLAMTSWGNALLPEFAVLLGHWLTYPLKIIRTRLIQQTKNEKYNGIFDCFVKMRQEEGTTSMWRGVLLDTLRVAIGLVFNNWAHVALTVPVFKRLPSYLALFSGVPAELLLGVFTFPISTIVTKLQSQAENIPKSIRCDVEAEGVVDCAQKTYNKSLGHFWNGYFAFCLRTVAQVAAVSFLTHAVWRVGYLRRTFLPPTSQQ